MNSTIATLSYAAIESRVILKTFFETGDIPTESLDVNGDGMNDFEFEFAATGNHIISGTVPGNSLVAIDPNSNELAVLGQSTRINELENRLKDFGLLPGAWAGNQGFLGVKFELASSLHYGFLQMRVDGPGNATPYVIHVDYAAWEGISGEGIETFSIPEPASCTLALAALCLLPRRRRLRYGQ